MKILCPDKKVLIPDMAAGCSLADSCKAKDLAAFKAQHPDHMVVSYVNTSADVKALTDVVVTSSNAKKIVDQLPKDAKIIFGPDHNLGSYINSVTGRNMILWNGACHVHSRFSLEALLQLKAENPGVEVLAHPECKAYFGSERRNWFYAGTSSTHHQIARQTLYNSHRKRYSL